MRKSINLFEYAGIETRSTLKEAIEMTVSSFFEIDAYQYDTWQIGFSGGKDSTGLVTLLAYLFDLQILPRPKRLIVHYADTGMEVPPLQQSALAILDRLQSFGFETHVVRPELDKRWFVYMLGRGVSLPSQSFRYCTRNLKSDPMAKAMEEMRNGEKVLLLTGVREGESAARDGRIKAACSKDGGECGQGFMHVKYESSAIADPLAPIRAWRVCHIQDWLTFYVSRPQIAIRDLFADLIPRQPVELLNGGFDCSSIAEIYGFVEEAGDMQVENLAARTGCMNCTLVTDPKGDAPKPDKMLIRLLEIPKYQYLAPLTRLLDVYVALCHDDMRLRRVITNKKGEKRYPKGPLTMEARLWGLQQVKTIQDEVNAMAQQQGMTPVVLIDAEEEARILELISLNTWPNGWSGTEQLASEFQVPGDEEDVEQLAML